MDEPTASLDGARRAELGAFLRELTSQGCTVFVATHDERLRGRVGDRRAEASGWGRAGGHPGVNSGPWTKAPKKPKRPTRWRQSLTPDQFHVLREHGTEPRGTSPLNHEKRDGSFRARGCGQPLFSSATKFESGTGWPSFWAPLDECGRDDGRSQHFMTRTEVHCAAVRRPSRPRVSGRAGADWKALLHERRRAGVRAGTGKA